jgi:thiaminase/transcriptional activator TenA
MTEYGHSFAAWRKATGTAWQDYVCHEFVTELGSGTLPKSAFLHYLVQDYLFLIHFSRAWALGVTKADDVAEMRACAATVNALVNDEISLHIRFCAEAGIDEATLFSATEETGQSGLYALCSRCRSIQVTFWI